MDFHDHGGEIKENIKYDFSVNINPLGMPDYVREILKKVGESKEEANFPEKIFCRYPDRFCKELREKIAGLESLKEEEILCGNGASELIMAICAYQSRQCPAGIHALVQAPTFSGYERAVKAFGGRVTYYKDGEELLFLLNKRSDCPEQAANLIFLCNPNNPTGEVMENSGLLSLLNKTKENPVLWVVDECFIDFTHEKSLCEFLREYPNLVVLKAFTKFYAMPGLRLGYLCAKESLRGKISGFLPEWNVSAPAQYFGIRAIENPERVRNFKEQTLKVIDAERTFLIKELSQMGIEVSDSKANFVLCGSKDQNLWEKLKEEQILVRNCSNFSGLSEGCIRVCVSLHKENERLIRTLKNLMGLI